MKKIKTSFSKGLLIQESALIWIITLATLSLAFICIFKGYLGTLPWLTAMIGAPWAAYGVSQGFYYNKSKAENTKDGIKFETTLRGVNELDFTGDDIEIENFGNDEEFIFEDFGPI